MSAPVLICMLFMNCGIPQLNSFQDTILSNRLHDNSFQVNYRMLPDLARYEKRYRIESNCTGDYRNLDINFSMQNFISDYGYNDSSILSSFNLINTSFYPNDLKGEKEMLYGAWRNKLTLSSSESEIKQCMTEGTQTMIDLGYSDLKNDLLPFITTLMEEQHMVNYDITRTKAFGKGSKGIVTSLQILNALHSQDTYQNFGVCRDVHETGRELLKTMAETWYSHFYPEKKIDFDDYIFLQSWVTERSHHVTVSLIDPLDTKRVYELDWGRVLERISNAGYDNGRMYGNTYRIWKFSKEKHLSVPVDFKRSHFGKILDENILTRQEYLQFNGIFDEEFYSDIRYNRDLGKFGGLNLSLGSYNPSQYYFLGGWHLETRKKKITGFLNHNSFYALQGAIHEDTRKKQFLFPHIGYTFAGSIMGIPRVISKFETRDFPISRNLKVNAFLYQQFDIFLVGNLMYRNDSLDKKDITGSGDGNLSFSNGVNLVYKPGNRIFSALTLQARSCLLPKEIRLFSPNIFTLFPNLRFITPAVDAISTSIYRFNNNSSVSIEGMFEFTNLGAIIWSGNMAANFRLTNGLSFRTSAGSTEQIKGLEYFWYPSSRRFVECRLSNNDYSLSCGILKYSQSGISCNITFMKIIR